MNLAAVGLLPTHLEGGTWFRVVPPCYIRDVFNTAYSRTMASRFSDGSGPSGAGFEMLYLSDSAQTALFEANAILGSYLPGGPVPHPKVSLHVQSFRVSLSYVVRLEDTGTQATVDMTAQELSGDWISYRMRGPAFPVQAPIGTTPTQMLGRAFLAHHSKIEGFSYISAKLGTHRNIAVFPQNMRASSVIDFTYDDGSGPEYFELKGHIA